jgi:hypothetical protein
VTDKLRVLETGQGILNAKTQLGNPLITPGSLSSDRADEIAHALFNLHLAAVAMETKDATAATSLVAHPHPPLNRFNWFTSAWNKVKGWLHKGINQIRVLLQKVDDSRKCLPLPRGGDLPLTGHSPRWTMEDRFPLA